MISRRSFLKALAVAAVVPLPLPASIDKTVALFPTMTPGSPEVKGMIQVYYKNPNSFCFIRPCGETTFGSHPTNKRTIGLNQKIWEAQL